MLSGNEHIAEADETVEEDAEEITVEVDADENLAVLSNSCRSQYVSVSMKWKLGAIVPFCFNIKSKASSKVLCRAYIRYARHAVTDWLIPAQQSTKTEECSLRAFSMKDMASEKNCAKF
ncbi:hypothetical protein Ddc_11350 [Ditylenchus destructor]|nr:hypothetical protein Ddc_11350 [Ditylenchus destructor]